MLVALAEVVLRLLLGCHMRWLACIHTYSSIEELLEVVSGTDDEEVDWTNEVDVLLDDVLVPPIPRMEPRSGTDRVGSPLRKVECGAQNEHNTTTYSNPPPPPNTKGSRDVGQSRPTASSRNNVYHSQPPSARAT